MTQKAYEMIRDLVTGREVPNVGAEENRQAMEKYLLDDLGYFSEDILVSVPFSYEVDGQALSSELDLLVRLQDAPAMVIRCVAGSVESYAREVLAAARLAFANPIPVAVATDAKDAVAINVLTGKTLDKGMAAVPGREALIAFAREEPLPALSPEQLRREMLIHRTYDSDNVNTARRMKKE